MAISPKRQPVAPKVLRKNKREWYYKEQHYRQIGNLEQSAIDIVCNNDEIRIFQQRVVKRQVFLG